MRLSPALLVLLSLTTALPAIAADDQKSEIVYRVNLGRASDVDLLLKGGASANATDEQGTPLLALAAARRDSEGLNMVRELLANGADINGRDKNGQTALFYAARLGNMDTVKLLLDKGIDYYAVDNNGDVARNLAYRNGHKEVGEAMDNFVKSKSEAVAKQYEDVNKTLTTRYQQETQEEQQSAATPASPQGNPAASTPPAPATPPDPAKQAAMKQLSHELSYNSCAFQYWYYLRAVKQSSELSTEQMITSIEDYKGKVINNEETLEKDYSQTSRNTRAIEESAKKRIFNVLNAMPSKSYRHERDVGKVADMEKRCNEIALEWDAPTPRTIEEPAPLIGGGGIQKSGGHGGKGNAAKAAPHPTTAKRHPAQAGSTRSDTGHSHGADRQQNQRDNAFRHSPITHRHGTATPPTTDPLDNGQ